MLVGNFLQVLLLVAVVIHANGQDEGNDMVIDCPLCDDPSHVPQDPDALFVSGDNTFTCQTAFDLGSPQLPAENCTFWQSRGANICQCGATDSSSEPNRCTLCDDGSSLPNPLLISIPGRSCAETQVTARRDEAELCPLYQRTFGVYCGCENMVSQETDSCRLCGDSFLTDPVKLVSYEDPTNSTLTITTTCVELEFMANLPDATCSAMQALADSDCCIEDTPEPTQPPSSNASFGVSSYFGLFVTSLSTLGAIFHS